MTQEDGTNRFHLPAALDVKRDQVGASRDQNLDVRALHEDVPRSSVEPELTQRVATAEEWAKDLADVDRAGAVEIKTVERDADCQPGIHPYASKEDASAKKRGEHLQRGVLRDAVDQVDTRDVVLLEEAAGWDDASARQVEETSAFRGCTHNSWSNGRGARGACSAACSAV